MSARTLMVQGTSSSAGKSLLVTALCNIFARRGLRVAPFKAQNMSNNAAVCPDGSEIGRAQYVQALAAGIEPSVNINPILIKPEADARSQVIVMGRLFETLDAGDYYTYKEQLWNYVTSALDRLRASYDIIIIEGAGSPAEINLRAGDIVNMAVARYAGSPVLLVGDIDRGGIFAQLLGTIWLLEPEERSLVRGFVVNKFRGDLALFAEGIRKLEEMGGIPVLGVIPYLKDLAIPQEDAVSLDDPLRAQKSSPSALDIAVIHLPLISNFDDFDPLENEPGVKVRYLDRASDLGNPDAVILPGTKSTVADLAWLRAKGLASALVNYAQTGGSLIGICGGFQMLGEYILDPQHVEAGVDRTKGLGLLPNNTYFDSDKATYQAHARINPACGWLSPLTGQIVTGYEIHMGRTEGSTAWLEIVARNGKKVSMPDGAVSPDGRIWGCYLHGIFANANFRRAWLASLGWQVDSGYSGDPATRFTQSLNDLANAVEGSLDFIKLENILWGS